MKIDDENEDEDGGYRHFNIGPLVVWFSIHHNLIF